MATIRVTLSTNDNKISLSQPIVKLSGGGLNPTGTLEIYSNGEYNVKYFEFANVNVPIPEGYLIPSGTLQANGVGVYNCKEYEFVNFQVTTRNMFVYPKKEEQTFETTDGSFFKKVVVYSIPSEYIIPSGTLDIVDTQEVDVKQYSKAQIKDENLKPENIAENVKVLGITGTFRGGIDTSDGNVTADDILLGKVAYAKEERIVGTIQDYDGSNSENLETELDQFISGKMKEYYNDKITEVKNYGFCGRALEKLSLPNVTTANVSAFYYMTNLKELNLLKLQTITGTNVIGSCTSLEYIYLPKLKIAQTQMLSGCTSLKVAVFDSIEVFSGFAFQGCKALEKLVVRQSEKICTITTNTFYGFTYTGLIYVPDVLVEDYKVATNWSVYAEQIKPLSEYKEVE